jgi:hypothetical protein
MASCSGADIERSMEAIKDRLRWLGHGLLWSPWPLLSKKAKRP